MIKGGFLLKISFLLKYLTQPTAKINVPEFRRIQFIRSASLILAIPLLAYAIYNIIDNNVLFIVASCGGAVFLLIINLMILRSNSLRKVIYPILAVVYSMVFISLYWGKVQSYSLIWMTCTPAITYYLIGSKQGLKINIGFLLFLFLFLLIRSPNLISYHSLANIMFSMVFLCIALYSYEKSRELYQIALEEKQFILERISNTDSLTELYNRTRIDEIIEKNFSDSDMPGRWCLILIDIDHFKWINDTYGHQEGDRALKTVAKAILDNMKNDGAVARWGGDEFLVFLHDVPREKIIELAESTRLCIEQIKFENGMKITISIGIALSCKGDTQDTLLKCADDYLYKAKAQGRNQFKKNW